MRNAVLVAAGVLVLAIGGVTYGAIRADDSMIAVCVSSDPAGDQSLKLAPAAGCGVAQKTLTWNQQGPPGVPGVQGVQGLTGPQGTAGSPAAAASDATVALAPALVYYHGFTTTLNVSGTGTHVVEAHAHVHLDSSTWKRKGFVRCTLSPSASPNAVDITQANVAAHGGVQDYDVDLSVPVTIDAPPSSATAQSTVPTDRTAVFRCLTTALGVTKLHSPQFTLIRMSESLEQPISVPLNIKTIIPLKKAGP
jgi:hypothetical protein